MSRRRRREKSKQEKNLDKLFGKLKRERGKKHEDRFFQAMEEDVVFPHWFKGVRRASFEQDRQQIDAICDTDVGEIYLQIKSSHAGRAKFLNKHPSSKDIACIVIHEMVTQDEIRRLTLLHIGRKRNLRLLLNSVPESKEGNN